MGIFVVKRIEKDKETSALSFGIKNPRDSSVLWIFERIESQGAFENAIKEMKKGLEKAFDEGNKIWRKIREEKEGPKVLRPGMDPEEAWEILEGVEEEEIFQLFNNLPDKDRKAIANFVFTNMNIFKERPLYFSQHYDYRSNLLIEV